MAATIFSTPATDALSDVEIALWRDAPSSIAADLVRAAGQIDPEIRPLLPPGRQPRLVGRAVIAVCEPPDMGGVLYAADRVGPGDVLMIAAGGRVDSAVIGDIVCGLLRRRGCVGIVCDGAVRDVATLAQWSDFSVFARAINPRGPLAFAGGAVNAPAAIGGAIVAPGDLVIGDDDGVVTLSPATARARIADARAKLALEARWTADLAAGRTAEETFGLPPPVRG